MSPEKNLDAKFCIHNVVWSLFRPSDSLKLHKYFFQQSWICAFKCVIDWTPELKLNLGTSQLVAQLDYLCYLYFISDLLFQSR